jgi:hypothetical protein
MTQLKQPMTLTELGLMRVVNVTRVACESWLETLCNAALTGGDAYLTETQNLRADCDSVHNDITPFPIGISKQLAPLIIKDKTTHPQPNTHESHTRNYKNTTPKTRSRCGPQHCRRSSKPCIDTPEDGQLGRNM